MDTITYKFVERKYYDTPWKPGPWDNEPDKIQWPDKETGLPCIAVRHPTFGHWCGYVGVSEGHPFFKRPYQTVEDDIDIHGGLTYSDFCQPVKNHATGICHVPGKGEPRKVWWFGFDCAHCDDASPSDYVIDEMAQSIRVCRKQYRTLDYVKEQCAALAKQIKAAQ